ncbi:hypothetical protein [Parabacteroides sp. Marseille-P3160]|uniref:hypothetical protein n=1 Tax=Parabacteroides sp. Marseille-P3160 TaxID=1917887 RepID=UPI0009BBD388|nr:hypothetical protein [Parabacteroides sp. Marseille-P3160]
MTQIQLYLEGLPQKTKDKFTPLFHDIETFYQAIYLIVRNEHVIEQEKPEQTDERLKRIREIRNKIEKTVSGFGIDGKEIMADIAGDYFDDYVKYHVKAPEIEDDVFLGIVRNIDKL